MKIHHIGIIVARDEWFRTFVERFGGVVTGEGYVEEYGAHCTFVDFGGTVIEFIFPRTPLLANFNRGAGGLHHIAFETDDLGGYSEVLAREGIDLLEEAPVKGAANILVNFIPPAYFGIPVEIIQQLPENENEGGGESE